MSKRIRSIRTQEIFGYEHYPVVFTMFEVFGFGKPLEHRCLMELPGVQTSAWGPPVQFVADQLGVELSEIRETYEKRVTDRTLEVAAGTIEAGTVGAVRFETIGVVDGRDAIVIEHVNRMAPDLAPDWPTADRDGTYRIMIDGEPSLSCELQLGTAASYLARRDDRHDDARRQRDPVRLRRRAGHRDRDQPPAHPSPPRVRRPGSMKVSRWAMVSSTNGPTEWTRPRPRMRRSARRRARRGRRRRLGASRSS